ncbi:hypothetical protein J6590_056230 [Homalodisca vitripennis]|nr:hypothetical protein J6590_056230 [Homalodisca vitripennis]
MVGAKGVQRNLWWAVNTTTAADTESAHFSLMDRQCNSIIGLRYCQQHGLGKN